MNTTTNWVDQEAISIHQNELYRDADNERLAEEAARPSRIVRVYESAIASLGNRMIIWGTRLQKRAYQPSAEAA